MRELKLKYFIDLASNIGAKARSDAQAVEQSQQGMQRALDKTGASVRVLDSSFARFAAGSATERQIGYMHRLGQGIDQTAAKMRGLAQLSAAGLQKAPAAAAGIAGGFYAAKALLDKPMDYSLRLAHMANTAFGDRDLAGRQAGKRELNEAIMAAVRQGGGSRDDGAATLDSLIASGAVPIDKAKAMLPALMKTSSASGAGAEDIGKIAIKAMQTFKISEAQLPEILDIAMKGGQAGGFELRDMAKWLPQMMAAGKLSGLQGVEGFRRIVAGAQASAITSGSKDEAGNNVVNLLAKINSQDTQKDFKKQGYDLTGKLMSAREKGLNSIDAFIGFVDEIAAKDPKYVALRKKLASATTKDEKTDTTEALASLLEGNAVGKVIQDRQALMYLLAEMNNRKYVADVMEKTRAPGSAIDSAQALIKGESSYKFQAIGNEKDNAMSSAFGGKSGVLNFLLDGATGLAREFPLLTTATVAAATALGTLSAVAGIFGLLAARNAGGLPGLGGPGGGLPRAGGPPGALTFPVLEGAAAAAPVMSAGAVVAGTAAGLALVGAPILGAGMYLSDRANSREGLSDRIAARNARIGELSQLTALGGSAPSVARMEAEKARLEQDRDALAMKLSGLGGGGSGVRGQGFNDPRLLPQSAPGVVDQGQARARPDQVTQASSHRGKGFNDPRLLTLTAPGAAEQALTLGQPTKIELGEGKMLVDVRVTDERTTATTQMTTPMPGIKVSAGATQPQGSW